MQPHPSAVTPRRHGLLGDLDVHHATDRVAQETGLFGLLRRQIDVLPRAATAFGKHWTRRRLAMRRRRHDLGDATAQRPTLLGQLFDQEAITGHGIGHQHHAAVIQAGNRVAQPTERRDLHQRDLRRAQLGRSFGR